MECPYCGSDNYDYTDLRDYEYEGSKHYAWWNCKCPDCGKKFVLRENYILTSSCIEEDE